MKARKMVLAAAAAALMAGFTSPAAIAEETLRVTTMLPKPVIYTREFTKWIQGVNERGKGIVKLNIVGGPEAIPTFEQPEALRKGVVDMIWGPGTYYLGAVPEVDVLVGTNLTPMELRANGGTEMLNKIHQKKLNAYLLGQSFLIRFHIYTTKEPKIAASGLPDLSGMRIRGGPIYREFFVDLGATFVNMPAPEVYTALERNAISGVGWPIVGIGDFSWDKHLKFRIDPGFFNADTVTLVNLDKWKGLSDKARDFLQKESIAFEKKSYEMLQQMTEAADKEMRGKGMTVIELNDKAAETFRKMAADVPWKRIKEKAPDQYEALRAKFYKE